MNLRIKLQGGYKNMESKLIMFICGWGFVVICALSAFILLVMLLTMDVQDDEL